MPWKIVSDDGSYCLVNKDTGKKVPGGCHPTRKEAQAQLRVLYANTSEAGAKSFESYNVWEHQVSQSDAEYDAIGGMSGKQACANCQFFDSPNGCLIVSGDISPTGKSRFWEELAVWTPTPMPVEVTNWGDKSQEQKTIAEKVTSWITGLFSAGEPSSQPPAGLRPVYVTKDVDGTTRAFLVGSNNFWDRHEQIIPEVVHNEYVGWVNQNPQFYPEFNIWHLGEKSRWGQADRVFRVGNFTVASGPVDPGYETLAEAAANDPNTSVSNGYFALLAKDKKEFQLWRPWEFSIMNFSDTANVWMGDEASLIKEGYMPITEGDKAFLHSKGVPAAFIENLEKSLEERGQTLTNAGVGSKANEEPVTPAVTPEAQAAGDMLTGIATLLDTKLTPLMTRLDALETGAKGFEEKLNKSLQEQVAEHIQAQVAGAAGAGYKASEDPNTIRTGTEPAPQTQMDYIGAQLDQILKNNGVAR